MKENKMLMAMEDFAIDNVAMKSISGGVYEAPTWNAVTSGEATREGECSDTYSLYTLDSEGAHTTCNIENCTISC